MSYSQQKINELFLFPGQLNLGGKSVNVSQDVVGQISGSSRILLTKIFDIMSGVIADKPKLVRSLFNFIGNTKLVNTVCKISFGFRKFVFGHQLNDATICHSCGVPSSSLERVLGIYVIFSNVRRDVLRDLNRLWFRKNILNIKALTFQDIAHIRKRVNTGSGLISSYGYGHMAVIAYKHNGPSQMGVIVVVSLLAVCKCKAYFSAVAMRTIMNKGQCHE